MALQHTLYSATLRGIEAIPVNVEVYITKGLPNFTIVGMPDAAIQEARERVRAAIRASGYFMPDGKVVVNLAPGSLKKTGSGFDLPIAAALLIATKQIPAESLNECIIIGELSLEGKIRAVKGLLAYALCAKKLGLNIVSGQQEEGLIEVTGVEQLAVESLAQLRIGAFLKGKSYAKEQCTPQTDYADVYGHDTAKRALQIAAAGKHGVLLMGPPGSGKTMLASRLPSILTPLTEAEMMEAALINSVVNLEIGQVLAGIRPFRKPHHSATVAGLVGGGNPIRPGEITLAHNGVLFLDELAEFKPSILQSMRQPMETGSVTLVRADGTVSFPARFSLVAASNPCPCGYQGDAEVACRCSVGQVLSYQNRIGGPLMDRIDIHVDVWRTKSDSVLKTGKGTSSATLYEGVLAAHEFASFRMRDELQSKTILSPAKLLEQCHLDESSTAFLEEMADVHHMSGRSIMRVLSIARTIADMATSNKVERHHVCEALSLRVKEGVGTTL